MNSVEQEARREIQKYFDGINSKIAPTVSNIWYLFKGVKNLDNVLNRTVKPSKIKLGNHELELNKH